MNGYTQDLIESGKCKNVVLIMCDQLRYDAIGANKNPDVITPHLDNLCNTGINFETYFANAPVCVPSRCSLFTGKYPHSHMCRENHTVLECGREIHLFRAAKQAGYSIGYFGKNHLLDTAEFANFDYVFTDKITPFTDEERQCSSEISEIVREAGSVAHKTAAYHLSGKENTKAAKWTNYAVDALKDISEKGAPFCFCLSLEEPHYPHVAPKEIWDLYEGMNFNVPAVSSEDIELKPPRYAMKQKAQHSDEATYEDKCKYLRGYYSLITLVDEQVGKITACLKECGLDEDTAIIFTSDHGDFSFNHGMSKKDLVLLDDLLHVPLIIRLPHEKNPGRRVKGTLFEEIDVMPTILDLIGADTPRGCQGSSMIGILNKTQDKHKDEIFAEINPPWLRNKFDTYEEFQEFFVARGSRPGFNIPGDHCKSIRTAEYKYIWYSRGWEELYDLKADPAETRSLANREEYADIRRELKLRLLEWNAKSENPLDGLLIRRLQKKYSAWNCAASPVSDDSKEWCPYWAEDEYNM